MEIIFDGEWSPGDRVKCKLFMGKSDRALMRKIERCLLYFKGAASARLQELFEIKENKIAKVPYITFIRNNS